MDAVRSFVYTSCVCVLARGSVCVHGCGAYFRLPKCVWVCVCVRLAWVWPLLHQAGQLWAFSLGPRQPLSCVVSGASRAWLQHHASSASIAAGLALPQD